MNYAPAVDTARYYAFASKIPLFCLVMATLTVSKIVVFAGSVPWLHGIAIPAALGLLAFVGGIRWLRTRHHRIDEEEARHELNKASAILFVACYIATANDLALYYFANDSAGSDERHFVQMLLLGEGICSFFFLMHLRSAALLMAGLSIFPSLLLYALDGTLVALVTTVNIVALAAAMMIVMFTYARDYASLAKSHVDLQTLGEENARLAAIDMVTELPNRREFFRELGIVVDRSAPAHAGFSIGIVDLDGFKLVNDTHGHKFGDLVLARVAQRLKECAGPDTSFFRLGGDEFAFICRVEADEVALLAMGKNIIDGILVPLTVGSVTTSIGCSIGMARFPESASTGELLYEYCDYALYDAKRGGRQRSVVFNDEHRQVMIEQGATEQALRSADLEQELFPVFQPITDSRTGRAVAYECLARWKSPTLGSVSPAKFIPVAEQCGLVSVITKVMLRKALAVMQVWELDTKLSFNLSPHDISNDVLVLELFSIIEKSGVKPSRIGFELTETALIQNFDGARRNIELLQASGIGVALDDFGAGYSSLSHVHALPLDKLKIDRRFIADVEHNETSRNIIRSVAGLCQDLGIECIVEGAETQAQVDALGALGCNFVQGYFYSKPLTTSQLQDYVAEGESRGKLAAVA
jgi:diguanylate cyclase (GGDEF)-like protein